MAVEEIEGPVELTRDKSDDETTEVRHLLTPIEIFNFLDYSVLQIRS